MQPCATPASAEQLIATDRMARRLSISPATDRGRRSTGNRRWHHVALDGGGRVNCTRRSSSTRSRRCTFARRCSRRRSRRRRSFGTRARSSRTRRRSSRSWCTSYLACRCRSRRTSLGPKRGGNSLPRRCIPSRRRGRTRSWSTRTGPSCTSSPRRRSRTNRRSRPSRTGSIRSSERSSTRRCLASCTSCCSSTCRTIRRSRRSRRSCRCRTERTRLWADCTPSRAPLGCWSRRAPRTTALTSRTAASRCMGARTGDSRRTVRTRARVRSLSIPCRMHFPSRCRTSSTARIGCRPSPR